MLRPRRRFRCHACNARLKASGAVTRYIVFELLLGGAILSMIAVTLPWRLALVVALPVAVGYWVLVQLLTVSLDSPET